MNTVINVHDIDDLARIVSALIREGMICTVMPGRGHGRYEVTVEDPGDSNVQHMAAAERRGDVT